MFIPLYPLGCELTLFSIQCRRKVVIFFLYQISHINIFNEFGTICGYLFPLSNQSKKYFLMKSGQCMDIPHYRPQCVLFILHVFNVLSLCLYVIFFVFLNCFTFTIYRTDIKCSMHVYHLLLPKLFFVQILKSNCPFGWLNYSR